jgi:hypothetical protein
MTEREVILLGLRSEIIEDNDDQEDPDYYYAMDIVNGLTLITPSRDELKDGNWYVEIFNTDPSVRFYDFAKTQGLINQLSNAVVKG